MMFKSEFSPIQELHSDVWRKRNLRVLVKRDDLLHPHISGNKWRKLKYNLIEARKLGHTKLLTFGGAYSNHLSAVAAAGKQYNFQTTGIVRGERTEPLNPTLRFAESCGMKLIYASRERFREPHEDMLEKLEINRRDYYVLPMGGSNCLALKGSEEIIIETESQLGYLPDYIIVASGTGATLAGIISGMKGRSFAIGVSVLKGDFLKNETELFIKNCNGKSLENWSINTSYHFGGYAKFNPGLISFINEFKALHNIPLDPVYTGKLFYAVSGLIEKDYFPKGSSVMLVHTGGLQGIAGFNERFGGIMDF